MCRSIKTLHNYDPPATAVEIREASLQFVRKVSGYRKPSSANKAAFDTAVSDIERVVTNLLGSLVSGAPKKNRDVELAKARSRAQARVRPQKKL